MSATYCRWVHSTHLWAPLMLELVRVNQQRLLTVLLFDHSLACKCRKIENLIRTASQQVFNAAREILT